MYSLAPIASHTIPTIVSIFFSPFPLSYINCKNFIIVYKADNPSLVKAGTLKVEYYKNGDSANAKTLTQNLNSYGHNNGTQESGWTNPVAILLIDEDVSSNYTIKLSLSSASEVGTILAFGYSN